jgi:hypothetical protein
MLSILWVYLVFYGWPVLLIFGYLTSSKDPWLWRKPIRPLRFRLSWLMAGILVTAVAYAIVHIWFFRPKEVVRLVVIDSATIFIPLVLSMFTRITPFEILIVSAIVALVGVIFFIPSVGVA